MHRDNLLRNGRSVMNHLSAAELKAEARERLLDKYKTVIGAFLIIAAFDFVISAIIGAVIDQNNSTGKILYFVIMFIIALLMAVFEVGETKIYMNIACGNGVSAAEVFDGFKSHADKAIILQAIVLIRTLIWQIPGIIVLAIGTQHTEPSTDTYVLVVLAGLLLWVIGWIISLYVKIKLSQCFFIFLDFPELSPREIVNRSAQMMEGHKGAYLYLLISFIPIELVGILGLGIPFVLIHPYMNMTYTEFYMDIVRDMSNGPIVNMKNQEIMTDGYNC